MDNTLSTCGEKLRFSSNVTPKTRKVFILFMLGVGGGKHWFFFFEFLREIIISWVFSMFNFKLHPFAYASQAWWGMLSQADLQKLNSVIKTT